MKTLALLALLAALTACSDNLGPTGFRDTVDCMANPDNPCKHDEE